MKASTAALALAMVGAHVAAAGQTSAYTATKGGTCRLVSKDKETGDRTTKCAGIAGYSVLVLESDDRASLTLQNSNGVALPLNFWDVVSPTFSSLGDKIEWRMSRHARDARPHALIVRLHTVDQSDVMNPVPKELLVTARIRDGHACVTGAIAARRPTANAEARKLADDKQAACAPPLKEKTDLERNSDG